MTTDRSLDNLVAFARVFGCVRFFHPSDQARAIDWDKLAVLGAEATRAASDDNSLRGILRELFEPIAPGIQLADSSEDLPVITASIPGRQRISYWQHYGVELGPESNVYTSRRLGIDAFKGQNAVPFLGLQPPPALWAKRLAPNLRLRLPICVVIDAEGRTLPLASAAFEALLSRLEGVSLDGMGASDWRLRVAGVTSAWNVFQHFHPYLDQIGIDWHAVLRSSLERALSDHTAEDYYATLSEMVAKLEDGHGYVRGRPVSSGALPIRVEVLEEQLVVTGVTGDAPCRKGDVVMRVDGREALDLLRERERYASGSPQFRRACALSRFDEGRTDSMANVEIRRDGTIERVELKRRPAEQAFHFRPIAEPELPSIREVRPGIAYVSLKRATASELEKRLPELANARGVIFDIRSYGAEVDRASLIEAHQHIIPHLLDEERSVAPMRVPCVTRPDREEWVTSEGTWSIAPRRPRLKGRAVFINEPALHSYGETCMAVIAHYRLATLVGAATGGCNGNYNMIRLPGGFGISWTGMEVVKHDGTPLYGIGYAPDYAVDRTIAAARAGRDEYLEKAIEVIEAEITL